MIITMKTAILEAATFFALTYFAVVLPVSALEQNWARNIREAKTPVELKQILASMRQHFHQVAGANKTIPFSLQEKLLMNSGLLMGRVIEFPVLLPSQYNTAVDAQTESILQDNLSFLEEIYLMNQNIINTYKEEKLDTMKNPDAFFNSREWQGPIYLISLSLYWMSWNRYYCAVLSKTKPEKEKYLQRAVRDFSTSIVDIRNPEMTTRGLFGRGICYKELQQFDRALRDLNTVISDNAGQNLSIKAYTEIASIEYLQGHFSKCLALISKLFEQYANVNVPLAALSEAQLLKASCLFAKNLERDKNSKQRELEYKEALTILKKLESSAPSLCGEIYSLIYKNAEDIQDYSQAEAGSVGGAAIGDYFFDTKQYENSITYYKRLIKNPPFFIKNRIDDIYFRVGLCYFKQKKWKESLFALQKVVFKFPNSRYRSKAATLGYISADNLYRESSSSENYSHFIQAVRSYLKYCPEGENSSEAHFAMAKYFQVKGESQKAIKHYRQVDKNSSHYPYAKYFLMQRSFRHLEQLQLQGKSVSTGKVAQLRKELQEFDNCLGALQEDNSIELKGFSMLFMAMLEMVGSTDGYKKTLSLLNQFEKRFGTRSPYFMDAKLMKINCYLKCYRLKEMAKQLKILMGKKNLSDEEWYCLYTAGQLCFREVEKFRDAGKDKIAIPVAEIAIEVDDFLLHDPYRGRLSHQQLTKAEMQLASLYSLKGNYAMSKKIYLNLLEETPHNGDVLYQLAMVYEAEREWDKALHAWERICHAVEDGSPYWFEGKYHITYILCEQGRYQNACDVLRTVEVLYPAIYESTWKEGFLKLKEKACREAM